ncbi:MAG TPA: hypothetical protein VII63_10375 [Caulobacteraceae bacterium]
MTKTTLCALSAVFLLFGGATVAMADESPVVAQTAPPPTAVDQAAQSRSFKDAHAANRVICKTTDTTGSRLSGERTCRTVAQWDQMSHDHQDNTNDFMRHTYSNNGAGH